MARPRKTLTPEQISQVEALAAVLNKGQIADYFGISENTLRAAEERQPAVSAALKKGKARAVAFVAQGLLKQAREGNLTAMIFYLKTQAKWHEVNRVDLGSEEDGVSYPARIEIVAGGPAPKDQ